MIDYSIFDKKILIWINLEFYFETYEFSYFRDFYIIFHFLTCNLLEFIWIYIELKYF